jgi:DNA repair exonuclease SbcCD ATPase subunit
MKLTSLVVEGFRGFGRRQAFLPGDVNIIGGPNGFGKTSFFDSFLWCLFGSIPRLSGTRDFVHAGDICQNKFSSTPHFVSLTFDTPAGILSIRRSSNSVAADVDHVGISEADCLARLKLGD